jgi:hypothetical protein
MNSKALIASTAARIVGSEKGLYGDDERHPVLGQMGFLLQRIFHGEP